MYKSLTLSQLQGKYTRFHGKPCSYCHRSMAVNIVNHADGVYPQSIAYFPTKDHVLPTSRIGETHSVRPYTLTCCARCNLDKSNMYLEEWLPLLRSNSDPRTIIVENLINSPEHKKAVATMIYEVNKKDLNKKRHTQEKAYNYNRLERDMLKRRHGKGK